MDRRFDNLPAEMKNAILALKELHNTPDSLAMPAVLGIANLAAMPHYKVDSLLFGEIPISLYILCMLPTGMRKTTNYREVSRGIERYERAQWERLKNEPLRYALDEKAFKKAQTKYVRDREENGDLATAAVPEPVRPIETCNYRIGKATLNGVIDQLKTQSFVGLFSSEAGEFFNSHSFQGGKDGQSRATEMSAALTTMWDGGVITRQTGMDSCQLHNRAVNMMFFLQEETVRDFLNNPIFSAQGFVHRMLITQSDYVEPLPIDLSEAGQAAIRASRARLDPFHDRIEEIIGKGLWFGEGGHNELTREVLRLTPEATELFQHYYNTNRRRAGGDLRNWAGFSERLLEHMVRIAGTLAAFERKKAVDEYDTAAAMDLMDYFVEQRLNLELGVTTRNLSEVTAVSRLGAWIQDHQFTGTANELRRRVRWFSDLTAGERDTILEGLVKNEQLFLTVTKNPKNQNRDRVIYSWSEE